MLNLSFFTIRVNIFARNNYKCIIDKFDDDLFLDWMKNPHYYHSYYDYDGYNHYNSKWNSTLQRMVNRSLTDDSLIQKIIEANLQYLQIVKGVDIAKKFAK